MEFAGGIATHSEKKFADDEAKLYDTCVQLLQEPWPILDRICTVLYYGNYDNCFLDYILTFTGVYCRERYLLRKFDRGGERVDMRQTC